MNAAARVAFALLALVAFSIQAQSVAAAVSQGDRVVLRDARSRTRASKRRVWRHGRWVEDPAQREEDAAAANFVPFHSPNITDAPTDARDAVASEPPAPAARRFVSDDGTRMITVSGQSRTAKLFDNSGDEPELIKTLGSGVEKAAFLQNSDEQSPHFVLFLPDDEMRRYDADGNLLQI